MKIRAIENLMHTWAPLRGAREIHEGHDRPAGFKVSNLHDFYQDDAANFPAAVKKIIVYNRSHVKRSRTFLYSGSILDTNWLENISSTGILVTKGTFVKTTGNRNI
jgi:hypothetical protein